MAGSAGNNWLKVLHTLIISTDVIHTVLVVLLSGFSGLCRDHNTMRSNSFKDGNTIRSLALPRFMSKLTGWPEVSVVEDICSGITSFLNLVHENRH